MSQSQPPLPRHLVRLHDYDTPVVDDLIDHAQRLKRRAGRADLAGRTVGMLFFRGSLRTRTSFEAAVHQLGGHTINLNAASDFWELEDREGTVMDGRAPEHIKDAAGVLSHYVNALAIRPATVGQSWAVDRRDAQISSWARHATVPVINMESALWHPLQALADLMTLREAFGELRGRKLAMVWVHSPSPATLAVPHSLLVPALRSGMEISVAHPPGFELDEVVLGEAQESAARAGSKLSVGSSLEEAVRGADVVYARSWQSIEDYGNPTLGASRRARLTNWKVDRRVMELGREARFMHAMPVRRNVEATDEVLDGPRSLVQVQAENRLHTQKALLAMALKGSPAS
jgi:N-acetylornithine carbamoyltransferase